MVIAVLKGGASKMGDYMDFTKADFGDVRLGKRLARALGQLASNPAASILAACNDPYQAKAMYRFVGNDGVTVDALTKTTRDVTIKNILESQPSVVLIPQDTTSLNYSGLMATEGLGSMANCKDALGIQVHTAMAVGENGEIFGLMAQKLWARPPEAYGKSVDRDAKPIEEKESYKWPETMVNAGVLRQTGIQAVHIFDREGDIYELFCLAETEDHSYLCRRCYNRKIEEELGLGKVDELLNALPAAGRVNIRVPRDSHTNRKERNAEVEIKHGKCKISRPVQLVSSKELPKTVEVYVVSAVEVDPPAGQEKILWQLITNVPTESFEDAVTRIAWYTQRWKIELFHRTLKDGCKVEELQSDTAEKLKKLVAVYSIIALQIMHLGYAARTRPDETCEEYLSKDEWEILYHVANKTRKLPERAPTIYEAVVMIAKLGGFPARKSDGFPGVTVIWRGLTSFYTILEAAPFLSV